MAGNTDNARLVVSLEARFRQYEKAVEKARRETATKMNSIEKAIKGPEAAIRRLDRTSHTAFGRIGNSANRALGPLNKLGAGAFLGIRAGAVGALAPILGVSAALGTAKAAMQDFDRIAKTAKAAGLDGEFYQAFAYQAELAGVSVGELDAALVAFIRNASQAANSTGTLYSQLSKSNPELLKAINAATSQEERLRLLANAIDRAASSTEKANIATAAFGRNGARMVNVFQGGADAMDATATEARRLGIVIDNDLLARAEDLNDEFTTATKVMDLEFKQALISLAPFLIAAARAAGGVAKSINTITEAINGLPSLPKLDLYSIGRKLGLPDLGQTDFAKKYGLSGGNRLLGDQFGRTSGSGSGDTEQDDAIRARLGMAGTRKPLQVDVPVDFAESSSTGRSSSNRSGGTRSRNAEAAAAVRQAEAVKELIADLDREKSLIGATDEERRVSETLRRAGAAATDEQRAKITSLIASIESETQATEALKRAQEELEGIGREALRGIADGLREGASAGDILGNVLDRLADRLEDMALDAIFSPGKGGGGIFSAISSIFGFAKGGIAAHGRPMPLPRFARGGVSRSASIFGEAGPEAAVPLPDGRSIPVDLRLGERLLAEKEANLANGLMGQMAKAVASSSRSQNVNLTVNVEGANGDDHVQKLVGQGVADGLRQYDKRLDTTIGAKVANYRWRFG